ncbi:MAG: hypothetical protein E7056_03280 [Lentisphaerae bacterium]|nr:hypothetical protein [Lentisphaerota bacterium]
MQMMEWTEYKLEELLAYEQPTAYIVNSTDYHESYKTPVLTAGKSFIIGYTNEKTGIYDKLPVIIFDDFTTASQYVNFQFKVKSSAMKILTANSELVLPKFIFYRMQTIQFNHDTHKRYWIQQYSQIKVKVPPLPEQERIVAKIEELFSQLDAAVAELKSIKGKLAIYRQAVMQNVIVQYTQDVPNVFIKDVCNEIKVGIVIKPSQYYTTPESGIKAFRSANVREFYIDDKDWVFLSKDGHLKNKRSEVHIGDILIVRSGYPGTACVVTEKFDGSNAIDVLIAVPNREKITPEYLCAYTNSPLGKKLVADKKRGVAQAHLNVGGYSKISIPIPEILVQNIIVEEIHQKVSICNNIEQTVDTALQQAAALRQSILKQAFEGNL